MKINPLYLKEEDLKNLKEIGRGTDGIVYKPKNSKNELYKIYYNKVENKNKPTILEAVDSNGVRIHNPEHKFTTVAKQKKYQTKYIDQEGVKIYGIGAVEKAIERQENIKRTQLQKRPIYIDGHFHGTVLYHHKRQMPFYLLKSFPKKTQTRVLKELLQSEEELLDNYIYHIDLGLQPRTNYKTANVLLSCFGLHPNIIDIDGKSAIYTEGYNENLYYQSLGSYKTLVAQILFDIDLLKLEEEDLEFKKEFLQQQYPNQDIETIISHTDVTPNQLYQFLASMENATPEKPKRYTKH